MKKKANILNAMDGCILKHYFVEGVTIIIFTRDLEQNKWLKKAGSIVIILYINIYYIILF